MKINLKKYEKPKKYLRKGKPCVVDKVNHCLRPATPEEDVRQRTLDFLNDVMEVPYSSMKTEEHLSHYKKGLRKRMDIVIDVLQDNKKSSRMLVECKAEDVTLADYVFNQAFDYSKLADIPLFMITNGSDAEIYVRDEEKIEYLDYFPVYDDLLKFDNLNSKEIPPFKFNRPTYNSLYDQNRIKWEQNRCWYVDENTEEKLIPIIINIAHAFLDETSKITDLNLSNGYHLVEDKGIRYTEFGNASGGGYPGYYRYFLIEDNNENVQLISFCVAACDNGRSLLIVAVDDLNKHHNSIQLSLNNYTKLSNNKLTILHNGTMAVGKIGAAKRERVLNYTLNNTSLEMYDEKNIYLGELDVSELTYLNNPDFKELITNLIEYALARDELRDILKEEHKNQNNK